MNRGRYCPVYNPMGTYKDTGSKNWYETTFPITSVYSAFQNIGTAIGRPDGKSDKYIYSENFIDKRTNAEKANIPQLLNEVHNGAINGSLGGYGDCVGTEQVTQTTTGTVATLEVGTKLKYSVGDVLQIWNGTTPYRRYVKSVNGTTVTLDSTIVKTAVAFIISGGKLPITMFKSRLKSKLYGSPLNYPQSIKDKLASGNLILLDATLVDEAGTSLIPSGQTTFKLSGSKAITMLSSVKSTDSDTNPTAPTWASTVPVLDRINNKFTQTLATGDIAIVNVTSSNAVANIATPKAVRQVGNYAVATNSHSIYKGNNLTQLMGKVAVGDGVKGLESKVVEDVSYFDINVTRAEGVFDLLHNSYVLRTKDCISGILNHIYDFQGTTVLAVSASTLSFNAQYYFDQGLKVSPQHNTITLDNSNSPAIKTLSTIATADDGELLYQVFGEEGKLNTTWGFDTDFSQLTNGTLVDLNGATVRTIVATTGLGVYK